mgnify:CR=1 FL=1
MYYTQRLKDIREFYELTQEQVAQGIGMKQEQYQRYEAGKNEIKASHIIKLCHFYNLSADYILGITSIRKEMPKR